MLKTPMDNAPFEITLGETFQHLSNPPIVEAVIHWQARAQKPFEEIGWKSALTEKLPEYRSCEPMHRFEAMMTLEGDGPKFESQQGLDGLRLTSDDKLQIVQFKRDGVVFSRLHPYQDWEQFSNAALKTWRAFVEIAEPVEIHRLGVRFINRIASAKPDGLKPVLREPPTCPANLPLIDFVYQSTFAVPDRPFAIRVIKLMQPSVPNSPEGSGLFLDCDVYTTKPLPCEEQEMINTLAAMRRLKNSIFFSLLTTETLKNFE